VHPAEQIAPIKPAEVPGSWLTGISEVQLPAHYKLKNIEETEAVKKRMLQGGHDSKYVGRVLLELHEKCCWQGSVAPLRDGACRLIHSIFFPCSLLL
jgi:Hepatocellular carcinoma-associated antigen 59